MQLKPHLEARPLSLSNFSETFSQKNARKLLKPKHLTPKRPFEKLEKSLPRDEKARTVSSGHIAVA